MILEPGLRTTKILIERILGHQLTNWLTLRKTHSLKKLYLEEYYKIITRIIFIRQYMYVTCNHMFHSAERMFL